MTLIKEVEDAEERKVIAVDFDKTLTTGEGPNYWEEDEREYPNDEVISFINEMYYNGHVILIWTARPWSQAATVESYLVKWEVEYHGLRCNKTGADLFVDDKVENVREVDKLGLSEAIEDVDGVKNVDVSDCHSRYTEEDAEDDVEEDNQPEPFDPNNTHIHQGEVVSFNDEEGYGYIEAPRIEEDVFFNGRHFHISCAEKGREVIFTVEENHAGPRVENVLRY